jgi:hypothetical protein
MDSEISFLGQSNGILEWSFFIVCSLLCLSFFLFLFKGVRRASKEGKQSIDAWTDMAHELGVNVEKRTNFFYTKIYSIRFKGHVISLSVPDYFVWLGENNHYSKGALLYEPKMYFSIDHRLPGRLALSISDIRNRQIVDENLNRYIFASENEKTLLRDKIIILEKGWISIRKNVIRYAEGPGYISDKQYLREIVEKLMDLSDSLEK